MSTSREKIIALGLVFFGALMQAALFFPETTLLLLPQNAVVLRELPVMIPIPKIGLVSADTATGSSSAAAAVEAPLVSAQAVVAIDLDSGVVLFEKNPHLPVYPASTVKLMTALVSKNIFELDEIITVGPETLVEGSTIGFTVGEQLYASELFYGLLLQSGNDAAHILANHHPLFYDGFINDMNTLSTALHLENTQFRNPSGLDHPEQFTTARDLSIIAREVMKDEYLKQVVGTKMRTVTNIDQTQSHVIGNTNQFLHQEPGVVGLKTGTTPLAGENLVTQIERDGQSVMIVLLGSQDRYSETKAVIDWVYQSHDWVSWSELVH